MVKLTKRPGRCIDMTVPTQGPFFVDLAGGYTRQSPRVAASRRKAATKRPGARRPAKGPAARRQQRPLTAAQAATVIRATKDMSHKLATIREGLDELSRTERITWLKTGKLPARGFLFDMGASAATKAGEKLKTGEPGKESPADKLGPRAPHPQTVKRRIRHVVYTGRGQKENILPNLEVVKPGNVVFEDRKTGICYQCPNRPGGWMHRQEVGPLGSPALKKWVKGTGQTDEAGNAVNIPPELLKEMVRIDPATGAAVKLTAGNASKSASSKKLAG